MDNPTSRLTGDDPDDDPGGATRRLDRTELPQEDEKAGLACLRCGTPMLETTAYAYGAASAGFQLYMRAAKSRIFSPAPSTHIDTMTCPNCGYIELHAQNLEQLATMVEALERDPRSN